MKRNPLIIGVSLVLLLVIAGTAALAAGGPELAPVRAATAGYHRLAAAQEAGYELVPGLDHCFGNPGVGAMGYHYIDVDALDTTLEATHPEAMVYASQPNGRLRLVAVEYIVPADAWDASGSSVLPELFGQEFHLNADLGVYVLHAWIWKNNPAGIFEDWNPNVTCP